MRKLAAISCISILSSITTISFAEGQAVKPPLYDYLTGGYLGLGLGVASNIVTSVNDTYRNTTYSVNNTHNSAQNGFGLQTFLGYGKVFNPFYVGGEIFYQYTNPTTTTYNSAGLSTPLGNIKTNIKQTNMFGFDAHLGYVLHDVVAPYVLIGGAYTKVNANTSGAVTANMSKGIMGLLTGAGIQAAITPNWVASMEYDYVFDGKFTGTPNGNASTSNIVYSFTPNLSAITARIAYKLDPSIY